jgi:hypothetical protein
MRDLCHTHNRLARQTTRLGGIIDDTVTAIALIELSMMLIEWIELGRLWRWIPTASRATG